MKKIIYLALGATMLVASCKKNDFKSDKELIPSGNPAIRDTLALEVTVNTTVTKDTYLDGIVYVKPGVTLTINPGVKIFGSNGPAIPDTTNPRNNKGTLCIEKGGKLIANGTPTQPIIWTSEKPAGTRAYGDWGGVVLYGKAPIHRAGTGANNGLFEAFDFKPDERNRYGGTDSLDNSGSITYNRFEFGGGVVYQVDKEVNGLTLCGVGAATTINHDEVLYAGDDAVEFFGGTVNVDHFLSFQPHDDCFDFDEGYHGNLQFIIAYQAGNCDNSGSHLVETDNDATPTAFGPLTKAFIANATFVGPTTVQQFNGTGSFYYDGGFDIRRNSRLVFVNSLVAAQKQPFLFVLTAAASTPVARQTANLVASAPGLNDSITIAYNLIQADSLQKAAVVSPKEGNPTPLNLLNDAGLVSKIGSSANANGVLTTFASFKLGSFLEPLAGSPALTGGANLAALGLPFFAGTTQRGAIRTTDIWTNSPWISIANN